MKEIQQETNTLYLDKEEKQVKTFMLILAVIMLAAAAIFAMY